MGAQRRVELALAMSEEMRSVTVEGIVSRGGPLDEAEVRHELLRVLHGDRVAAAITSSLPRR